MLEAMKGAGTDPSPETSQPPAVYALIRAIYAPLKTSREADRTHFVLAWAVHLVCLIVFGLVAAVLAAWNDMYSATPLEALVEVVDDLLEFFLAPPEEQAWQMAELAGWFVFSQVSMLVIAFGLLAWAGRAERARKTYARVLKRLYLTSMHFVMIFAVAGAVMMCLEWVWRGSYLWGDMLGGIAGWLSVFWGLGMLLAVAATGHGGARSRWPAGCEGCGYPLLGIDQEGSCPECGRAMADSLGPEVRPGVAFAWKPLDWLKWSGMALAQPRLLGQQLSLLSPTHSHRRFLAVTCGTMFFTSVLGLWLGIAAVAWALGELDNMIHGVWEDFAVMLAFSAHAGASFTITMLAVTLGSASLVGSIASGISRRPLLTAAMQSASYLSGFHLIWGVLNWAVMVASILLMAITFMNGPGPVNSRFGFSLQAVLLGAVLLINGGCWAVYLALLGRMTRAARFANW